jgi:hypothetical protein
VKSRCGASSRAAKRIVDCHNGGTRSLSSSVAAGVVIVVGTTG